MNRWPLTLAFLLSLAGCAAADAESSGADRPEPATVAFASTPVEEGAAASGTQRPAVDQEGEFFDEMLTTEDLAQAAHVEIPDPDGSSLASEVDEQTPAAETLVLQNKTLIKGRKGKELDPRKFDEKEWAEFLKADDKNWQAHLSSGAMRIVPAEEAKTIDRSRILPIPARLVRTNKADDPGALEAKSRLVVPGHLAPKEEVRADARRLRHSSRCTYYSPSW